MESIFFEISLVLIMGTLCATIAKVLKQPMIPAYILGGVILGPPVLGVIEAGEFLETLSTFGISFLLFLVGIELDVRKLLKTGKAAVVIGVVQMAFAVGVGYLIIIALGFESFPALFLALALGFSSTIVVLKLFGERKEIDSLHGQLVIGLMLTQDFIAILLLIFFNVFVESSGSAGDLATTVLWTILKGGGLILLSLGSAKFVLSHVFRYFARSTELLFLGAISWCLVFALLSHELGFSIEVGSLLAGVSLSFVPYSIEIASRIKSLRDFFLPIFFAILGGQLVFSGAADYILPTLILSALVLFASPVLVSGLLLAFGYRARTSFKVGSAIGQVSEFSFILVSLGLSAGVIDQSIVSLVALIGLVTMTLSTYMIEYSTPLYIRFRPWLKRFERKAPLSEDIVDDLNKHVVLFGHHTMGQKIRTILEEKKIPYIVVDHNPDVIEKLTQNNVPNVYGGLDDDEVLEKVRIQKAKMIISTAPTRSGTVSLLQYMKENDIQAKSIMLAFHIEDAQRFYDEGADYVLHPTLQSAAYVEELLTGRLDQKRKRHLKEIQAIALSDI
jgi:Kef-type K+ transport system membrane component KefB